ncbi:hypothetical protein LAZ67_7001233 [Cordylochernes scorpioides]|uniref:DUF5641 domain-containing protein n=1 Tax=Cordylochernes scorpioides TaxID=51811 RepID=A0ABY6KN20_9ARAC|nr:hypothetical protein LAZ67_7001233 [Cordylochernes scorpioides]
MEVYSTRSVTFRRSLEAAYKVRKKSVEKIVNSRPITYVSSDPTEEKALTPNHFLRGSNDAGPAIPSKINATDNNLRNQWKRAQILADRFWIKWTRDYIPKLATRSKSCEQTEPISIGDLVFLVNKQYPRNMWKRSFISDVRLEKDLQVQVVKVTTKKRR